MKYVVYCDESRHDGAKDHLYMAIGGLWVPAEKRDEVSKAFRSLQRDCGLRSEVKWCKTSRACLSGYKRLVDFFFDTADINFRVIIVEHAKLKLEEFHGGDRELGFYKFYYEMLIKWLTDGNQYLVLLDFKQNKGADRYKMLRKVLEQKLLGTAWVSDLTVIDSHETPLAQLADLLTGATATAWCGTSSDSAKADLIGHVAARRGWPLKVVTGGPQVQKFNLFKIDLQ
jgi:hypothetical protein